MMRACWRRMRGAVVPFTVFVVSIFWFGRQLEREPYFIDEGAYLAQTYYYRLMKAGDVHHVDWLHLSAYDHLQVGRLLIGLTWDVAGVESPTSLQAMEQWYGSQEAGEEPFEFDRRSLVLARWPIVVLSALGVTFMFLLGRELAGTVTGLLAALGLASSPLYFTHARRAMIDDPLQALTLLGLYCVVKLALRPILWRRRIGLVLFAGLTFGLSAASKLNGAIPVVAACATVGVLIVWAFRNRSAILQTLLWGASVSLAAILALSVFLGIHPFFYAKPTLPRFDPTSNYVLIDGQTRSRGWIENDLLPLKEKSILERGEHLLSYRRSTLRKMLTEDRFAEFALPTVWSRVRAMAVEGLGRWSAVSRMGLSNMWGGLIGGLLVLMGLRWCWKESLDLSKQGNLPWPLLMMVWPAVEILFLMSDLTLNWDRYYLGVVVWSTLLGALGIGGTARRMARRLVLAPPAMNESVSHA